MYPLVLEDAVLDNIKTWVTEDSVVSGDECNWKYLGRNKPSDSEMLRTYATGLLAIVLSGGSQIVEDLLTLGLSAKLMRYLRMRVLGEASSSHKDANYPTDGKHNLLANSVRGREDNRGRSRQVLEGSRLGGPRIGEEGLLGDPNESELTNSTSEVVGTLEKENADLNSDVRHDQSLQDGKSKYGERQDGDESLVLDSSRRRLNRGCSRIRGKGRNSEVYLENERALSSPTSGLRLGGRASRDRVVAKSEDTKEVLDARKNSSKVDLDSFSLGEDNDDRLRDCSVGSKDISEMVKKAIEAAEGEARAANAPAEAIKAAGDAAAELVKTTAIEAWKNTNDEDAALLAASKAAATVVDAAMSTEVSRSSNRVNEEFVYSICNEDTELEDFIILDDEPLSQLREKYSIQCLQSLGEYVEALGPILHEKGVDVCLALLQRSIKDQDDQLELLPEVLKLICALAAHRKIAAVFVDRGGMQKLLSVRRVTQTFFGLSSCLFTIGSLQGIMERVCALPSDVVHQVVELALQLLECSQDQARKNAATFFSAAFVFRAVLDSFDAQEGLQKMLSLLQGAASVRSGGNSGTLGTSNVNLRNDRSPVEVLTASEKQIAYHTCVALRQYFRAQLLLLLDSLRPNKGGRSVARNTSSSRAAYKPLDISSEAMDAVFLQMQRDRKLGPAFVRARWPAVDKFLAYNGHITMLELCQAPPIERYLHDLAQYALGVLHIVTLIPYSRKSIVNATLSNDRVGMAVILDSANATGYADPEIIHPALNVLVNLVCPPPSISNKPSVPSQGHQPGSVQTLNGPSSENRERNSERNISVQNESRELDRSAANPATNQGNTSQVAPGVVVGDRRISLGQGAGCAGLAAQLEQGYRQAREAVRANNGIKVLLHLLHPRMITPPGALDCIRALACRVLLGLARDDTIAHILTKLQVGKKLSELIRDSGSQASGNEQGRWQAELAQVAIELIAILTNSGRASTLAATDAAAPTLRRIERAAIAAATPISYHSRELLQLIHEHLQASGLTAAASALQKEAELTPLTPLGVTPPLHQISIQETPSMPLQWPSYRTSCGFLQDTAKVTSRDEDSVIKCDPVSASSKKKPLIFSSNLSLKKNHGLKSPSAPSESLSLSIPNSSADLDPPLKTPILLPMKRKLTELKDPVSSSPAKRIATADLASQSPFCQTPKPKDISLQSPSAFYTPRDNAIGRTIFNNLPGDNSGDDIQYASGNAERMTLDSLVVQYLKHQHRQCPAPITTLPPLSLLHPHVCPESSLRLNAPANVTARVGTREFRKQYGGIHSHRRDRQFIYSRFRPCRTCRDDVTLLTCITFLGDSSRIATGSHSGELKIFDTITGNVLESQPCHQTHVTMVESAFSGGTQLVLSSGAYEVKLWDAFNISNGPLHSFEGCKTAQFSHSGSVFAALSADNSRKEVLLYDVQTCNLDLRLPDNLNSHSSSGRGQNQSLIHFSPLDTMVLWNGVLWDRRSASAIHRFDQFTDYGGGGFHPAGNEVILNSEVWDLRKFKLLRSVPCLDQTVITFNGGGDVIYAILRRNLEDVTSAVQTRRVRHPLFPAFRTIDAVNYSEIATVQVDRCVLDLAADPTDSFIGVVAMDDHEDMFSSARLYEVGRKRPTDDDSDPDDGGETDEEEDEDEDEENDDDLDADVDPILAAELAGDGDTDSDDDDDDEDIDSVDEIDEDGEFNINDGDFGGGPGLLEIMAEGDDEDDDDDDDSLSSGDEGDFAGNGYGF
ncbi:DDB1- and CUL4-associated factor homolog 1 isoform X2 [Ananas comosus]|nr:DDB1- and CUL4-associated factor homolog 1 isoform X2 [Ananas comosus]